MSLKAFTIAIRDRRGALLSPSIKIKGDSPLLYGTEEDQPSVTEEQDQSEAFTLLYGTVSCSLLSPRIKIKARLTL